MRFQVPQNIDIEDRIVSTLTAKQFLWMLGAGILTLIVYKFVDISLFAVFFIIIFGIAASFAFIKPYGQTMIEFLNNFFIFTFKNKEYVWKRQGKSQFKTPLDNQTTPQKIIIVKKEFPSKQIEKITKILDEN